MRLVFSPAARADLLEIGDYIAADSQSAADAFVRALAERCRTLRDFPESGCLRPELGKGLRCLNHRSYLIFYRLVENTIRIERVLHGSRDLPAQLDP